jgi:DNA invertase Pin-like site-specific DNA recombinase
MPRTSTRQYSAPLDLTGSTGAAYIRVSDDQQDTQRQYDAITAFEARHGVTITRPYWFEDRGWARDKADVRPEFQRLIGLAERGVVHWIVVDRLDRFGAKNSKQLMVYLYRLEESGCRLFDASGKEWTGQDDATEISAWVEGKNSAREQREKSHRTLGGQVARARAGEWLGGPVKLGLDVACYRRDSSPGEELWRVIFEDRNRRLKVFPDGRTERFDGEGNFPRHQPTTELLRIVPSRDRRKVAAAVSVFKRYATEAVSFTALAHYLNSELGLRNSCGGPFRAHRVEALLSDPAYIGYYRWNQHHAGKFNRYSAEKGIVEELNYDEVITTNAQEDWVLSDRLFEPLVDAKTWDAVQRKLAARKPRRVNAPRSPRLYLAGLLVCANCGGRMVAGPVQRGCHYFCGTYHRFVKEGKRSECKCLRNAVTQEVIEGYVSRYLEEVGIRLEQLLPSTADDVLSPVARLNDEADALYPEFELGLERLTNYLRRHRHDDYRAIVRDSHDADATPHEYVEACLAAYRRGFDPSALSADIATLEAEHTALMAQWSDLPTPLAKAKAKAKFADLEGRITALRQQQEDVAEMVEGHYRDILDLQAAVEKAKKAMQADAAATGERALRQRAEALRAVVQRVECKFVATGISKGGGPGNKTAALVEVTFYPVGSGEPKTYETENALQQHKGHCLW